MSENGALAPRADIEELEAAMLAMPQVECALVHHFGPGIYIREVTIPAGTLVVGHSHKHPSMNILLKGRIVVLTPDGGTREMVAPMVLVAPAGRKVAFAIDETVWQNVFATEETDLEALEAAFIDKSPAWLDAEEARRLATAAEVLACLS